MIDRDAQKVLSFYLGEGALVRQIEPLPAAGGWSG
jgi:hypothetical protein